MKILTLKDFILGFIYQNIQNKDIQKQIHQIIDNENSVFLYSKKFFLFIKEELSDEYLNEFERLFTKYSDLGISVPSSKTSQNFDEELIHIYSVANFKVINSIGYEEPNKTILNNIPNVAVLSKQQKPNYNWLATKLAILHPNKVTFRCFEFSKNSEISQLFKDFFSIPKTISGVNIFDSQCNLNHDKFDYLLNNSIRPNYYTKFSSREKNQFERRDEIKKYFGNSTKVFLSNRGEKAHGRRIIFENIIISTDEDFWNIEIDASDWNIDIEYNEEIANKWLDRKTQYSKFN
ncbi:hypothetical protein AAGV33_05010 [Flavobacterium sp. FBOR7N2.3]|uniref:WYL domain-containing protein n=1 Tax=Flavobacterium magnesitis TaxID=3138077 RepID=A0ABV4TIE2_9FLAO